MLSSSDPVASIIPAMSLDSTSDDAMSALTRLALGPVNHKHYLPIFERFDDAGRTTTTWNWTACLFTLNWMVFRQLWGAALVYVAAAEGLALMVLGLGRSLLHWPQGVEWGVLGTVALMAFAVPGLYGDAILYADIRKRVARALAASRTVPEACALLEKQASSRKRLQALVLINLVLAAAAGLAYLVLTSEGAKPLALEPAVTVAEATAAAAAASPKQNGAATGTIAASAPPAPIAAPASVDVATTPPAQEREPARVPSAPLSPAQAPTRIANAPAQAAAASPSVAPKLPQPAQRGPASAPSTPSPPAETARSEPRPHKDATARNAQQAKTQAPAQSTSSRLPASAASAALPSPTEAATVGVAPGYYINVGLFAEESNARKAQARLLNEGLPAFRQTLNSANGQRIRVRVGPYESRPMANEAASAIRAMALEAVVFKQ